MIYKNQNNYAKLLIFGVLAITVSLTPNFNKDSLIIPKLIILVCLALFFLPIILNNLSYLIGELHTRTLCLLALLLVVNSIMILIISSAPIEQLIFGRTGRGLGFLTFISILIIMIASSLYVNLNNLNFLLVGLVSSGLVISVYSCLQFFSLDLFKWDSKTNGIIGTLGNPNSVSSFTAMTFIPAITLIWASAFRSVKLLLIVPLIFYTIFISQSTQGYIGLITSVVVMSLLYLWYRKKLYFYVLSLLTLVSGTVALFGMLGHGPLSYYLYKVSVQSRGDFWRSAFTTGNANPFFGVGFDTFGDFSLKYRDNIAASHSFAEYTDSAHNFYLDYLATGGYPYLVLNTLLVAFVLISFFRLQRSIKEFNPKIAALFCAWIVIQLQTIINTQTITFLSWNALISGTIIGITRSVAIRGPLVEVSKDKFEIPNKNNLLGIPLVVIGLIFMFPFFNTDRLIVKAGNTGNGDLLIKATVAYPQSVTKYSQASRALLESGLPVPSLFLAQKGVDFNPHAVSLWSLILINQSATLEERQRAKEKILELDPFNTEVKKFLIK
jgi:hypothetical protein